jgi:hypothetical protein
LTIIAKALKETIIMIKTLFKNPLYLYILMLSPFFVFGCGFSKAPGAELPTSSKGYVLYVFVKKTEVMIDYTKRDGISNGTKMDVFRTSVSDSDEPVKIGEIVVDKVGNKMSKAKVTVFTSSLQMERGDRVFPHPVTIISDTSWITSKNPVDGWRSNPSLPDNLDWKTCEALPESQLNTVPEIKQLAEETGAKPIWHPSATSQHGDVYFRKVFLLDVKPTSAKLTVLCGGKTDIYINDTWIGTAKEWPEISNFKADFFLKPGNNIIAIHTLRDSRDSRDTRTKALPLLFTALIIQTELK